MWHPSYFSVFASIGMGPTAQSPVRFLCAVKKFLPRGAEPRTNSPSRGLRAPPRDRKPLPELSVLPVGLMHAASFPPPPPPPASLTRICARPLLPPRRERARRKPRRRRRRRPAPAPPARAPPPHRQAPGADGCGGWEGGGGRRPGRAPPRRRPRARYLSSRARGDGGAARGRRRGGGARLGRARGHAPPQTQPAPRRGKGPRERREGEGARSRRRRRHDQWEAGAPAPVAARGAWRRLCTRIRLGRPSWRGTAVPAWAAREPVWRPRPPRVLRWPQRTATRGRESRFRLLPRWCLQTDKSAQPRQHPPGPFPPTGLIWAGREPANCQSLSFSCV